MWYCVPVPNTYQGWLFTLLPVAAPVTGVPAEPGLPADCSAVTKVCGGPSLPVRFRCSHHDQSPLLLPSDALVFQLLNVRLELRSSVGADEYPAPTWASNFSGMRVT